MSTNTYAGTNMRVSLTLPATNDVAGFEAIETAGQWVGGECSLRTVPSVGRTWNTVSEDLVCAETNTDVKASSKYKPWDFPLSTKRDDPLQNILRQAEESRTLNISVELTFPGDLGKVYVQAQCSMYDIVGGGGQDAIVDAAVQLLPQKGFVHNLNTPVA